VRRIGVTLVLRFRLSHFVFIVEAGNGAEAGEANGFDLALKVRRWAKGLRLVSTRLASHREYLQWASPMPNTFVEWQIPRYPAASR